MITLGFEVGTGAPVNIPARHLVVTGQTQESGKTTTLEALVSRSGMCAIAFVTKRGEGSFAEGRRIAPYFRERADWQFVDQLLEAQLKEKNKFLRSWIIKICRDTKTLAEVQRKIRKSLETAKGMNEGVYTQLDAYLDLIVPEIGREPLAKSIELTEGLNVMDVSGYTAAMQMLFVRSAIEWVYEHARNVVTIIPEAWEFIPEGKGSPVKSAAVDLVRKGAGLGNYIWVDSQDTAGVDKVILRGCPVWIIGVQREINEIKRNIENIPANVKRPKPADVAMLKKGQFYVCWGENCIKTYVWPAWCPSEIAVAFAKGNLVAPPSPDSFVKRPFIERVRVIERALEDDEVDTATAARLTRENEDLKRELAELRARGVPIAPFPVERPAPLPSPTRSEPPVIAGADIDDALYRAFKFRLLTDKDPALLRILAAVPVIEVEVERRTITMDGTTLPGRLARLVSEGWFDQTKKGYTAYLELQRLGASPAKPNVYRELARLAELGFLTKEGDEGYKSVPGMKVKVVER